MRYGSHVSTRQGYLGAAKTALALGATAFQYFPKNPRSLQLKQFDRLDAERCRQLSQLHGLSSIAHSSYIANIAVEDAAHRAAVAASLANDLEIAEACGSIGVVVHFGKYKGKDPLQGYKNSLQCLNEVLHSWTGKAKLLLENMAGETSSMGATLDESVHIRALTQAPEKIGFCLDTCHLFASGVWDGNNEQELMKYADEIGYLAQLAAMHLNDSKHPMGSRRDRHANLGTGLIGLSAMERLLNRLKPLDIPVILETPTSEGKSHQEEIHWLHHLLGSQLD